MKIFMRIIIWVSALALVFILGLFGLFYLAGHKAEKMTDQIRSEIRKYPDGKYHGSFSFLGDKKAEIEFRMVKGKMADIHILTLTGTPGYGADYAVQSQIDRERQPDFDAATGATITSHFARAAIMDALRNGPMPPGQTSGN